MMIETGKKKPFEGRIVEELGQARDGHHLVRLVMCEFPSSGQIPLRVRVPYVELYEGHDGARLPELVAVSTLVHLMQNISELEIFRIGNRTRPPAADAIQGLIAGFKVLDGWEATVEIEGSDVFRGAGYQLFEAIASAVHYAHLAGTYNHLEWPPSLPPDDQPSLPLPLPPPLPKNTYDPAIKTTGQALRVIRERSGLRMGDLARALGTTASVVSALERDQVDRLALIATTGTLLPGRPIPDVLHPDGRCTCAGEDTCDWCKAHPIPTTEPATEKSGSPTVAYAEAGPFGDVPTVAEFVEGLQAENEKLKRDLDRAVTIAGNLSKFDLIEIAARHTVYDMQTERDDAREAQRVAETKFTEHTAHVEAFLSDLAEYLGLDGKMKPAEFIARAEANRQAFADLQGQHAEACVRLVDARAENEKWKASARCSTPDVIAINLDDYSFHLGRGIRENIPEAVDRVVTERNALQSSLADARAALNRDRTGLAAGLEHVVKTITSYSWLLDSRGPYEWDDDRYKDEAGLAMRDVSKVAREALEASGSLADKTIRPIDNLLAKITRTREIRGVDPTRTREAHVVDPTQAQEAHVAPPVDPATIPEPTPGTQVNFGQPWGVRTVERVGDHHAIGRTIFWSNEQLSSIGWYRRQVASGEWHVLPPAPEVTFTVTPVPASFAASFGKISSSLVALVRVALTIRRLRKRSL